MEAGDREIDHGSGERDPEFFPRFGGAFQARDAADGIHHDFERANAVQRADEGVTEFVQQHRRDHRQHEQRVIAGRLVTAEANHHQANEQQNEGEMQANGNAH